MRQRQVMAATLLVLMSVPATIRADDHEAIVAQMAAKRKERIVELMTTQLDLTTAQQATLKTALDTQDQGIKDLQQEFSEKLKALSDKTDADISATFTDEQKAKYPDVKKQLQDEDAQSRSLGQKMGAGESGGGGGGMGRHGGGRHGGF